MTAASNEVVRSYADAFYEVARMLGISARTDTPANVWREEMQPLLAARLAQSDPRPVAGDMLLVLKGMLASYAGQPTPAGEAFKIIDAELEGGSVFASMTDDNLLREALEQVARPYGMLDLAVSENMHGPRGDDMLATAKLVRQALATHSPAPMAGQREHTFNGIPIGDLAAGWRYHPGDDA